MGKGNTSVPPPPPMSVEERDFLSQQNLTLQDLRGMLSDSRLQQAETQGILKNLSGLYTEVTSPETRTPGSRKEAFSEDLAKAYINSKAPGIPSGLAGGAARTEGQRQEQARRRAEGEVTIARGDADLARRLGLMQITETPEVVTPGKTEMKVNQEAVNTLKKKLDDYQAQQDELTRKSQVAQGSALDALQKQLENNLKLQEQTFLKLQGELGKGPSDLEKTQTEIAQLQAAELKRRLEAGPPEHEKIQADIARMQAEALRKQLEAGPSAYEKAQEEIGLLQADRLKKALRGELPVSEGTLQRKGDEFRVLKESLARRGSRIEGDAPETAYGSSSSAAQSLGEFNRTYKLIEDAERRGEISSGAGINQGHVGLMNNIAAQRAGLNQSQAGLLSDIAGRQMAQNLSAYGATSQMGDQAFGRLQSLYGQTGAPGATYSSTPGATSLNFMQSSGAYGPGSSVPGYQSLLGSYSAAMQPYTNQRNLTYQGMLQNASLAMQGQGAMSGLLGYGGSAALMSGNPYLGAGLLGAGYLSSL